MFVDGFGDKRIYCKRCGESYRIGMKTRVVKDQKSLDKFVD